MGTAFYMAAGTWQMFATGPMHVTTVLSRITRNDQGWKGRQRWDLMSAHGKGPMVTCWQSISANAPCNVGGVSALSLAVKHRQVKAASLLVQHE